MHVYMCICLFVFVHVSVCMSVIQPMENYYFINIIKFKVMVKWGKGREKAKQSDLKDICKFDKLSYGTAANIFLN